MHKHYVFFLLLTPHLCRNTTISKSAHGLLNVLFTGEKAICFLFRGTKLCFDGPNSVYSILLILITGASFSVQVRSHMYCSSKYIGGWSDFNVLGMGGVGDIPG